MGEGVPKISKSIHNTKGSGDRASKCATNQKNPLKRERKKSKRNCHGKPSVIL